MQSLRKPDIVVRLLERNIGVDAVSQIGTFVLVACNLARKSACVSTL